MPIMKDALTMKVTINIECTPEEARSFVGLPDLTPLHALYIERMQQLMTEGVSSADLERMLRHWMPGLSDNLADWQKSFWAAATGKTNG
jgi:hypothetical protein